ncbi:helix-turn-helix transcriptional regulator [Streptomyces niveus]|uniref:helix-turn-helix transcriptional regulator n=1 Tax=Streptomyces niveus TaxID=193462 RepID=UPI0036D2B1BC
MFNPLTPPEWAQDDLPPPEKRTRLREAAGLSQAGIATALSARRQALGNWETGRTELRPPEARRVRPATGGPRRPVPRPGPAAGTPDEGEVPQSRRRSPAATCAGPP